AVLSRVGRGARDLVHRDLGPVRNELEKAARELEQVRLREVAVERLAVGPLLDGDEAQRGLDRGEEPLADAASLRAGVVLHLGQQPDDLVALLRCAAHAADYEDHALPWPFFSAMNSASDARACLRTPLRTIGVHPSMRPAGPSACRAQA